MRQRLFLLVWLESFFPGRYRREPTGEMLSGLGDRMSMGVLRFSLVRGLTRRVRRCLPEV